MRTQAARAIDRPDRREHHFLLTASRAVQAMDHVAAELDYHFIRIQVRPSALRSTALPDGLATTALARFTRRAAGVGRATQTTTLVTRAAGGAMGHALATGAPTAQLTAVAYAKPMPAGATDPIATSVTTARISTAAAAATSLWVASKVAKTQGADGSITTSREDIYGGKIVPFVPFTKLEGDQVVGTHNR